MSDLTPCIDCGIEFSEEILRAHLAQRHTVWTCKVCGGTIRRAVASLGIDRLNVCSWECFLTGCARGHCRRCCSPPAPTFVKGNCRACSLLPPPPKRTLVDELEAPSRESEPHRDERAAWLPPQYRRAGWRLDRAPFKEDEEAA